MFGDWYVNRVSDIEFNNAASLLKMGLLFIRDGHFKICHNFTLNKSEINDIIEAIATAWSIPYSGTCFFIFAWLLCLNFDSLYRMLD